MQISSLNSGGYALPVQNDAPSQQRTSAANVAPQSVASAVEVPAKAVQAVEKSTDASSLKKATDKLNQAVKMMESNLQFTIDEETGLDVVKVVDMESKEVIRQIPSKEVLAIAQAFDRLQGLLVRDKA